jgi:hypothetical protein
MKVGTGSGSTILDVCRQDWTSYFLYATDYHIVLLDLVSTSKSARDVLAVIFGFVTSTDSIRGKNAICLDQYSNLHSLQGSLHIFCLKEVGGGLPLVETMTMAVNTRILLFSYSTLSLYL